MKNHLTLTSGWLITRTRLAQYMWVPSWNVSETIYSSSAITRSTAITSTYYRSYFITSKEKLYWLQFVQLNLVIQVLYIFIMVSITFLIIKITIYFLRKPWKSPCFLKCLVMVTQSYKLVYFQTFTQYRAYTNYLLSKNYLLLVGTCHLNSRFL